jgi:ADP-ribose pyrophosphatase YjhB (NUDIX family)
MPIGFDTDSVKMEYEKQAKIGVCIGCLRDTDRGREYLIHQRLKQPYYGYHGLFTGKIKLGERVLETAARELEEESGLAGDMEVVAIKHKTDFSPDGNLLEDKYFFIILATNLSGTLLSDVPGCHNFWATLDEIKKLPDLFDDAIEILEFLGNPTLTFMEKQYTVTGF